MSAPYDDRVKPMLLAQAAKRGAYDWNYDDVEPVIAELLARTDLTQAAVAAALEGAAGVSFPATWREDASEAHKGAAWLRSQRLWSAGFNACRDAIRALITAPQHDALQAAIDAAVAEARAEDAKEIADLKRSHDVVCETLRKLGGATE